jgi:hypothetical protein
MTERREESTIFVTTPDVEAEIQRLWRQLKPELRTLLDGKQPFQIEIHGKPGHRCRLRISKFIDN